MQSERSRQRERTVTLRHQAEYERALETQLLKLFRRQGQQLGKTYRTQGELLSYDFDQGDNRIEKMLSFITQEAHVRFQQKTAEKINRAAKSTEQQIEAERWATANAAQQISNISATTKRAVNNAITFGLAQSMSETEIANLISVTVSTLSKSRARTIARTEVHKAANTGALTSALNADFPVVKTWVSVEDSRTRDCHAAANGQQVPAEETFTVCGESVMKPGEGSPRNAINCRCAVTYEPQT